MNSNPLLDHLEKNPLDWEVRLFLADFYDRSSFPRLAAGQRWQVLYRKSPLAGTETFYWESRPFGEPEGHHYLEWKLLQAMLSGPLAMWSTRVDFTTFAAADQALANALFPEL